MDRGNIKKIKIFFEKGKPPREEQKAVCAVDLGLQGDRYAKGGEKQLTLISSDCVEWMEKQPFQGLCFARFKANLEVDKMDVSALKEGEKLACGPVLLQLSSAKKECFEECPYVQKKQQCMLRTNAKYLKVLKGGTIELNSEISKQQ